MRGAITAYNTAAIASLIKKTGRYYMEDGRHNIAAVV